MLTDVSLAESYRHVRQIAAQSRSNFYRSFWMLPPHKRSAMHALYAFARITDDLSDCHEPTSLRTQWLDWWRKTTALNLISEPASGHVVLAEGLSSSTANWPIDLNRRAMEIMPALRDTTHRFQIPSRYLLEIVDGVIADQQKTRFDTYEQLEHYCYLVASSVGFACLHIWEFEEPLPFDAAVDCGLAFQLTNILRDISEDADRGRIYLPRQHYEQHGICEDDLLNPRRDDRLSCLIIDEVARAQRLFDSGWRVWDSLSDDGRPMFSMMWRTYRKLLQRIADDPTAVTRKRISLTYAEKTSILSHHWFKPLFRRLPVPPTEVGRL